MTRKIAFFEGWSWFKFNNFGLALGTNLKFCTSVEKVLKLKVRKFWGPNSTFVEVTGEKLVGEPFCPHPILNRVKIAGSLKHLSNFWRTLEMPLISCKINLILTWSENCVISSAAGKTKFAITDTKPYVPVVTLSTQDNS